MLTIVYKAVLVDHVFGRETLPDDEARAKFESARQHALVHGGAAVLLEKPYGKVIDSFSHVAENE